MILGTLWIGCLFGLGGGWAMRDWIQRLKDEEHEQEVHNAWLAGRASGGDSGHE